LRRIARERKSRVDYDSGARAGFFGPDIHRTIAAPQRFLAIFVRRFCVSILEFELPHIADADRFFSPGLLVRG